MEYVDDGTANFVIQTIFKRLTSVCNGLPIDDMSSQVRSLVNAVVYAFFK